MIALYWDDTCAFSLLSNKASGIDQNYDKLLLLLFSDIEIFN